MAAGFVLRCAVRRLPSLCASLQRENVFVRVKMSLLQRENVSMCMKWAWQRQLVPQGWRGPYGLLPKCWLWKRGAAHPGKAKEPGLVFLALS